LAWEGRDRESIVGDPSNDFSVPRGIKQEGRKVGGSKEEDKGKQKRN